MKYLERIKQTPDHKLSESQEYQAADNKSQLEADRTATERALVSAKRDLENLKSAAVLSGENILAKQDDIKGLEEGLKALNELIEELF